MKLKMTWSLHDRRGGGFRFNQTTQYKEEIGSSLRKKVSKFPYSKWLHVHSTNSFFVKIWKERENGDECKKIGRRLLQTNIRSRNCNTWLILLLWSCKSLMGRCGLLHQICNMLMVRYHLIRRRRDCVSSKLLLANLLAHIDRLRGDMG